MRYKRHPETEQQRSDRRERAARRRIDDAAADAAVDAMVSQNLKLYGP